MKRSGRASAVNTHPALHADGVAINVIAGIIASSFYLRIPSHR